MQYDLMRLTIAANFGHGARLTGERATFRKMMLERFLHRQSDAYFEDMGTEICLDRSLELDDLSTSECRDLSDEETDDVAAQHDGDAADIPDDDDAVDAEEPGTGGMEKPKSMTKSEFYKAYKSKGTYHMYCDIMNDPTLRASAEILTRVTKPLHMQYQQDLIAQQQGLEEIRRWQAQRCLGASFDAVAKILAVMLSPNLCKAMRVSPRCNPPIPVETTLLEEDFMLINKAFRFGVHLAGNYAWSEMLHRLTLPLAASALLSTEIQDRKRCMSRLKKLVEAIIRAENMVIAEKGPGQLGNCLRDVAFQEETFAREIMIYLKRANYKLDSPHTSEAVKAMSKFTHGSSSTKEDYLYLDHAGATHPVGSDLLFNYSFDITCKWKFVEHTLIPPACMPDCLPSVGCAAVVHNSDQWILKGAIQSGLFLNLQRLKQVCSALGMAKPAKGSGKNGALTKLDWSKALVSHLWPDCSQDFLSQCVSSLQGWTREKVDIGILALASNLDCDNQEAFKNLKKHAERSLEEKIFGKGKASVRADTDQAKKISKAVQKEDAGKKKEAHRLFDLTPADLKALLPGAGAISGVFWMRYHPVKKFWRADYPLGGNFDLAL
eukprot:s1084_g13.t1